MGQLLGAMQSARLAKPPKETAEWCVALIQKAFPEPENWQLLKLPELKEVLKKLGLTLAGNKAQLADRLHQKFKWQPPPKECKRTARIDPASLEGLDDPLSSDSEGEQGPSRTVSWEDQVREPRVPTYAQEVSSLGMNILYDELEQFSEDEKDVLAEMQELKLCEALVDPKALDPIRLGLPDLGSVATSEAQAVIARGPRGEQGPLAREASAATLDPTQRLFYDSMLAWAQDAKTRLANGRRPKPLRAMLLGTAGAGKSATLRLAVDAMRDVLGEEAVTVCARNGVASFNTQCKAQTMNSLFPGAGSTERP